MLSITTCLKPSALSKRIGRLKNLEVLRLNAYTNSLGMDKPLREVKKLLLELEEEDDESSVIVVTAPGGCGKTTLVKQICQDPDVKGIHHTFFSLS